MKQHKKEHKIKNEKDKISREKHLLNEMKDGVKTIYLDGNNMFYIDSQIRKLCLSKKMNVAQKQISELSFLYGKSIKVHVKLIFDRGNVAEEKESEGVKMSVLSAAPDFETSDDALVVWAGGLSASDLESTLFVTSDRGLLSRLIEKGATNVMKSGVWWKIMKEKIGENVYVEIVGKKQD